LGLLGHAPFSSLDPDFLGNNKLSKLFVVRVFSEMSLLVEVHFCDIFRESFRMEVK